MVQHKILFTGPVGAGKTTAINAISDVPPVMTDVTARDMTKAKKPSTTVTMDYGFMNLDGGEKIHLYGTPGKQHIDFTWDILTKGGIGLILLLDNTRPDPFKDMTFFLGAFNAYITKTQVAIGITQMDVKRNPTLADYQAQLKTTDLNPPIFAVDARVRNDVSLLVQALLYSLDPGIA